MAHSPCNATLWIKYDGSAVVGETGDGTISKDGTSKEEVSYNGYYYKNPESTQYCNLYTKKPYNCPLGTDYHLTEEEEALYGSLTYSSYWVNNFYNEVYTTITAPTGSTVTVVDDLGVSISVSAVIDNGDGTSNYIIESRTDTQVEPNSDSGDISVVK